VAGPPKEQAVIHPDIQYMLCRMEHQERVSRGLRHQEVSRALAEAKSDRRGSRPVTRPWRALVAAFTRQREARPQIARTETP
jgi:hypothetical protein